MERIRCLADRDSGGSSDLTAEKNLSTRLDFTSHQSNQMQCETPGNLAAESMDQLSSSYRQEMREFEQSDALRSNDDIVIETAGKEQDSKQARGEGAGTAPSDDIEWKVTLKERQSVNISGFEANDSPSYSAENSEAKVSCQRGADVLGSLDEGKSEEATAAMDKATVLMQRVSNSFQLHAESGEKGQEL